MTVRANRAEAEVELAQEPGQGSRLGIAEPEIWRSSTRSPPRVELS